MFFKNLKTKEFKELKLQIELLWIEIDILTMRYKRKVKKVADELDIVDKPFDDGFDDLRKLNKDKKH